MPQGPDTPGRLLATARVRAGLTLGDVAVRSKVPIAALEAIDQDDYRRIGAPVYARGFVRLYAREVGLDPEVPIGLLDQALQEAVVTAPEAPRTPEAPSSRGRRRSRAFYSLAAVALLAVVLLVLFSATQGPTAVRELHPDAAPLPVVVPLPVEVVGEGAPEAPAAPERPEPAAPEFQPPAE